MRSALSYEADQVGALMEPFMGNKLLLMTVLMFIVVNLVVDLLYGWLDPRIRFS